MANADDQSPRSMPQVAPPQDLHPMADIRFVIVEVSKLTERIDQLIADVKEHGTRLRTIETAVDRVKTGAYVAGVIFSLVGVVFWWAIGDKVTLAVRSALTAPPVVIQAPAAPVIVPAPPNPVR